MEFSSLYNFNFFSRSCVIIFKQIPWYPLDSEDKVFTAVSREDKTMSERPAEFVDLQHDAMYKQMKVQEYTNLNCVKQLEQKSKPITTWREVPSGPIFFYLP